jgi:uncharacterized lipoprotein YajG
MKHLPLLAALLLAGCATHDKTAFTPPSAVAVQKSLATAKQYVKPEGKKAFSDLSQALTEYQGKVDEQTIRLSKAEEQAAYWHQKHSEALSRLWWWRGLAIGSVAFVVIYIGIKSSWRFFL